MTYHEAEQYLFQIPKFKKKSTLEDTRAFYALLGCPAKDCKVIHVAGTNGKGSVCSYLMSVLTQAGYRVGSFTSPHLVTTRERIRIGRELITEEDFVDCFEKVKNCIGGRDVDTKEQITVADRKAEVTITHPSYFEYLYFMAMLYFEKQKPDFILLETGLGGRKDATNSFPNPVLSIITKIGIDHTEYLGASLEEIAGEKAGIVKKGTDLVYFADNDIVSLVMENMAKSKKTKAFPVKKTDLISQKVHEKGIDFSYDTRYYGNSVFHLSTQALYQCENAAIAIESIAVLQEKQLVNIRLETLQKGLLLAKWEGRMEEIAPDIYLDGAHNEDGIQAFLETVRECPCKGRRILLFSVVADKEYEKMAEMLRGSGLFDLVVLTSLQNSRAVSAEEIASLFGANKMVFGQSHEAYEFCLKEKEKEDQVFVAGSLYLVGQIKEYIIK